MRRTYRVELQYRVSYAYSNINMLTTIEVRSLTLKFQDAVTLKKVLVAKKHELDQIKLQGQRPVRSARIRVKKAPTTRPMSASIAALPAEDDGIDDEVPVEAEPAMVDAEEDETGDNSLLGDEDDPLWQVFKAVKNHRNSLGLRYSEPFLRLPNRRLQKHWIYLCDIINNVSVFLRTSEIMNHIDLIKGSVYPRAKCKWLGFWQCMTFLTMYGILTTTSV